ncbi:glycoside hydrolase family 16 protein [Asticcacaulis sp.]|uniref:glycoside hydrolase family 16 protein n=1 Tax=Asticcacaulis sp. TaxID=1872648 RepID=UPI00391D271C
MSRTRFVFRSFTTAFALMACVLASCGGGGGGGSTPATGVSASSASSTASTSSSASASASSSSSSPASGAVEKPGYTLTFNDEFDALDVSANGPGTKWTAHTPWHGDFGDALFADPVAGFPFTVENGILRIEARKRPDGKWESGLLASVDAKNVGFKQQYGYFEMRAKLPSGEGVWPAFWLDSMIPPQFDDPSLEIDVMEYYGQFNDVYHSTVKLWPKDRTQISPFWNTRVPVRANSLTTDFHIWGVSVEPDWIIFYLDGVETWRTKTPDTHKHEMMILVNLALGGGWPITNTPNPSYMYLDYIRAYKKVA